MKVCAIICQYKIASSFCMMVTNVVTEIYKWLRMI